MEEINQDVNTEAQEETQEPVSESSPEPVEERQEPAAEPLNTDEDKTPESVPYTRFKEKIDEYNSLKEQHESYKKFEEYLDQNPEKAEAIKQLLAEEKREAAENSEADPITSLDQRLKQMEHKNMVMEADRRVNAYKEEFSVLVKKANIPEEHRSLVEEFTELKLITAAKGDPVRNFDVKHLHSAFKDVTKQLDSVLKADKSRYINGKLSNEVPTNKGGSAPAEAPKSLDTREDRNRAILEELRAGNK